MSLVRSAFLLIALMCLVSVSGWAAGDVSTPCSAPNAGLQILKFGSMNLAVWYPTSAPESPYPYFSDLSGSVALNGAVSTCAKYPLLVFSHGYGGCGTQSVFFTEQLARSGFIVAAPDHADAGCSVTEPGAPQPTISLSGGTPSFADPAAWNSTSYYNRYVDNENTIDGMLAQPELGPQIDSTRIAMSGHSLGGYDTFAMIGGWSSWLDPRLKVGLMLSPYIMPFLDSIPSTVPIPDLPQMYMGGTNDVFITPYIMEPGGQYAQAQIPKLFLELQGAGHLAFANYVCTSAGQSTVAACLANVPTAAYIDNYAIDYLNYYLNNQTVSLLWSPGSGLAAYWRNAKATTVSSASYLPGGPLAANEIGALFAEGMTYSTTSATLLPLPNILGSTTVTLTDSQGTSTFCPLFFISAQQVNFLIPPGSASGTASVTVTTNGSVYASGHLTINANAPSIFSLNNSGSGLVAAYAQNSTTYFLPYNPKNLAAVPLNVSAGNIYLVMAGTGAEWGTAADAQASIGSIAVPVSSIGPYPPFVGLDAIVLGPLPASLSGAGMQTIHFSVNGVAANPVSIDIQ
jgi:uncharacterized protein (TIGR03437 family)